MQTGATNLLNIDLQRDGMHDVAPCSSLCCELSRNDHAMRSHERSQWGELRSLRLRLSFCRYLLESRHLRDAQLFQIFPESIPASLCSLLSVLGGLLPFKCVLTVLAPKQGSCSENPQEFPYWTPSL